MSKLFYSGAEALAKAKEKETFERPKGFSTFRQPTDSTSTLTLIDEIFITVMMHKLNINQQTVWKTCLGDDDHCPYCEPAIQSRAAKCLCLGTVINHTGFINDKNTHIRGYRQNLLLRGDATNEFIIAYEKLMKKKDKKFSLLYTTWDVRRGSDPKSLNTGVFFEYKGKMSKPALVERLVEYGVKSDDWDVFLTPDNYEATFARESEEEARRFLGFGRPTRIGSTQPIPAGRPSAVDDMPFDVDRDEGSIDDEVHL